MTRNFVLAPLALTLAAGLATAQPTPSQVPPLPAAAPAAPAAPSASARDARLFELRTYYAADGKYDAMNARLRDHSTRMFEKYGVAVIGYWVPAPNPDNKVVFLLAYPSRAARDQAWKTMGTDADWERVKRTTDANGNLVDRIEERFLTATDYSPAVAPVKAGEPRTFELRVYTAGGEGLDALHARFRDGLDRPFEKHGITNVGFFTLAPGERGADKVVVYLLAHKAPVDREKALVAFRADPDAVIDGRTVQKKLNGPDRDGVRSVLLMPTDYSPMK